MIIFSKISLVDPTIIDQNIIIDIDGFIREANKKIAI